MKRNMVPLLGIAFVVAIISTGVFYGLFAGKLRSSSDLPGHAIVVAARDLDRGTVLQLSDLRITDVQGVLGGAFSKREDAVGATLLTAVKVDEPLIEERVAPRLSDAAGAGLVPTGMRAVSIRVSQSESLLNVLRPGSRVDLQAVSERPAGVDLRTVLENVKVLAVSAPDANSTRGVGTVVMVLIPAEKEDLVALSDAGSRIRVALRNPLDEGTTPRHSLALASVFSGNGKAEADAPQSTGSASTWDHPIQLHVRVLEVNDASLAELRSQLQSGTPDEASPDGSWRVSAFRSGDDAAKLIHKLEQKHELEVISSERLMAGVGRPISYRAGVKPYQLHVQFSPRWLPTGKLSLRVEPELRGSEVATSRYDAGVPDTSSFLVQGFVNDPPGQNSPARLFPGRSWEHKHLVVFVTARSIQQTSTAAVARSDRGR